MMNNIENRLKMSLNNTSNYHEPEHIYKYPLEEIYYSILCKSELRFGSSLDALFLRYQENNHVDFTLEEVILDGWIRTEFEEYYPTIGHRSRDAAGLEDKKLRNVVDFLNFIKKNKYEDKNRVAISQDYMNGIIAQMKNAYPDISIDWFVEKSILVVSESSYIVQNPSWKYTDEVNRAAARHWDYIVSDYNECDQRLSLFRYIYLNTGSNIYACIEKRDKLVQLIVKCIEGEPDFCNFELEDKIATILALFEYNTPKAFKYEDFGCKELRFYSNNLLSNLEKLEGSHWSSYMELDSRKTALFFGRIILRYFSDFSKHHQKFFSKIVDALFRTGFFSHSLHNPQEDALFSLLKYEETQFCAIYLILENLNFDIETQTHLNTLSIVFEDLFNQYSAVFFPIALGYTMNCLIRNSDFDTVNGSNGRKGAIYSEILFLLLNIIKLNYSKKAHIIKLAITHLANQYEDSPIFFSGKYIVFLIKFCEIFYLSEIPMPKDELYIIILTQLKEQFLKYSKNSDTDYPYMNFEFWTSQIWYDIFVRMTVDEQREFFIILEGLDLNSDKTLHLQYRCLSFLGIAFSITHYSELLSETKNNIFYVLFALILNIHPYGENTSILYTSQTFNNSNQYYKTIFSNIRYIDLKDYLGLKLISIENLVFFCHYLPTEEQNEVRDIINERVSTQNILLDFNYLSDSLIIWILNDKHTSLYGILEEELLGRIKRLSKLKGPHGEQLLQKARFQLNYLYFLQSRYDHFTGNHDFYRAIMLIEEVEKDGVQVDTVIHNSIYAKKILFELCEKSLDSNYVINYLNCVLILLSLETDSSRKECLVLESGDIIRRANHVVKEWDSSNRREYAIRRYNRLELIGQPIPNDYIYQLEVELNIHLKGYLCNDKKVATPSIILAAEALDGIASNIMKFNSLLIQDKFDVLFRMRTINYEQKDLIHAGVIRLILDTCNHLSMYIPQLYRDDLPNEDNYNQLFREMFNHAYGKMGMQCSDQEQSGYSGSVTDTGKRGISEIDFSIRHHGNVITIGEALILSSVATAEIDKHFEKLLASNNANCSPLFLIIYCRAKRPVEFWENYCEYVSKVVGYDFSVASTNGFEQSEIYQKNLFDEIVKPMKILCTTVEHNAAETIIYHIFIDAERDPNFKLARDARTAKKTH